MERRVLAIILLIYVAASCVNIHVPFLRHIETAGTEFGKMSRNLRKFGLLTLRFGPLDLSGPRLEDHGDWRKLYMTNRNMLPTLYFSLAWGLFGDHEWVYRVSLILVGIVNILLFRRVARRILGDGTTGLVATAFFALSPMMIYFGQVAGQYDCSLLAIQAVLLAYWRWKDGPTPGRLACFYVLLFLGCNTGWPVYYAGLLVAVYEFFLERPRRPAMLLAPVACLAFFGIHLLHLAWLDPDLIRALAGHAQDRIVLHGFSPLQYLLGEARDVAIYHTVPVALLAVAWLVRTAFSRERSDVLIAGLLILGAEEVIFYRWSSEHDFFTIPLQIFFALAAARGLEGILRCRPPWARHAVLAAALLAFGAQSAVISHRRLTTFGALEFYYRLARAIETTTRPDEKIMVATHDMKLYTPFYADRYMTSYDAERKRLVTEIRAPAVEVAGDEDVLAWIRSHRDRCDWIVVTTRELARKNVRFLADAPDDVLRSFQVDVGDSKLRAGLEQWVAEGKADRIERGGFLFYRLR